jgi:SAM-dependent methyltransferase
VADNGGESRSPPAPERLARYRWAAELVAGSRVLDVACGAGWGTATLGAGGGAAVGVDLSPAAIADARREHGGRADFHEGEMLDLPFAGGEFDNVVCFEALVHVAEPGRALDEMRRVLRPGGLLLVSAPNRDAYPPGNPLHLSELSSAELERLLSARFANVAVHRQQAYFASLLCDTATLAQRDPAATLALHVVKGAGGPPESELHAVAIAGDGELPPAPAWLALGEDVDHEARRRLLAQWRERAVRAEAEALALRKRLRDQS